MDIESVDSPPGFSDWQNVTIKVDCVVCIVNSAFGSIKVLKIPCFEVFLHGKQESLQITPSQNQVLNLRFLSQLHLIPLQMMLEHRVASLQLKLEFEWDELLAKDSFQAWGLDDHVKLVQWIPYSIWDIFCFKLGLKLPFLALDIIWLLGGWCSTWN